VKEYHPPTVTVTMAPKVYHQSNKDDWGTPLELFHTLQQECSFELDVCATPENAKCDLCLTPEMNALEVDWFGKTWMNPPFSKVHLFIKKQIQELEAGHVEESWALVAARPDTQWFLAAVSHACEVRFLKGRLTFEGAKSVAPFPSAILRFNKAVAYQKTIFWDWKQSLVVEYAYYGYKSLLGPWVPSQLTLLK
jgi:phage N-6-adenine-methyltransferase